MHCISKFSCNNNVASQHLSHATLHCCICNMTSPGGKLLLIVKLRWHKHGPGMFGFAASQPKGCWFNAVTRNLTMWGTSGCSAGVAQLGRNVPVLPAVTIGRHRFVACKQWSTVQCDCVGASPLTLLWWLRWNQRTVAEERGALYVLCGEFRHAQSELISLSAAYALPSQRKPPLIRKQAGGRAPIENKTLQFGIPQMQTTVSFRLTHC